MRYKIFLLPFSKFIYYNFSINFAVHALPDWKKAFQSKHRLVKDNLAAISLFFFILQYINIQYICVICILLTESPNSILLILNKKELLTSKYKPVSIQFDFLFSFPPSRCEAVLTCGSVNVSWLF